MKAKIFHPQTEKPEQW